MIHGWVVIVPLTGDLHPAASASIIFSGSAGPGELHAFAATSGSTGIDVKVSMVDTFTLHSGSLAPGASVSLTALLSVDGTVFRMPGVAGLRLFQRTLVEYAN